MDKQLTDGSTGYFDPLGLRGELWIERFVKLAQEASADHQLVRVSVCGTRFSFSASRRAGEGVSRFGVNLDWLAKRDVFLTAGDQPLARREAGGD